jgi:hypothetical protein
VQNKKLGKRQEVILMKNKKTNIVWLHGIPSSTGCLTVLKVVLLIGVITTTFVVFGCPSVSASQQVKSSTHPVFTYAEIEKKTLSSRQVKDVNGIINTEPLIKLGFKNVSQEICLAEIGKERKAIGNRTYRIFHGINGKYSSPGVLVAGDIGYAVDGKNKKIYLITNERTGMRRSKLRVIEIEHKKMETVLFVKLTHNADPSSVSRSVFSELFLKPLSTKKTRKQKGDGSVFTSIPP